jgi:hypothetical protein
MAELCVRGAQRLRRPGERLEQRDELRKPTSLRIGTGTGKPGSDLHVDAAV